MSVNETTQTNNSQVTEKSSMTTRLLILLHPDGFIEVFSNHRPSIRMVLVPYASSKPGELRADELIRLELPKEFSKIYGQDCLRATENLRIVTPNSLLERQRALNAVRFLSEVQRLNKEFHGA